MAETELSLKTVDAALARTDVAGGQAGGQTGGASGEFA